jgi:polysaccharide pyruvyl transferase CsaB
LDSIFQTAHLHRKSVCTIVTTARAINFLKLGPALTNNLRAKDGRNLVVISGYYGFDNLGDEAILEELINELKECVADDQIVVLSNSPEKTARLYQVKALDRWNWSDFFSLLPRTKLFISGGGGLFQDTTGPGSAAFYGWQVLASRLSGAQVLLYGQGLGPLKGIFTSLMSRLAWKAADRAIVRDEGSLALAKKWGVDATLTADAVWSLRAEPLPPSFAALTWPDGLRAPVIGISLRPSPVFKERELLSLPELIQRAFPQPLRLLMLPFQERDLPLLKRFAEICEALKMKTQTVDPTSLVKPSQWLSLMQGLDMMIGMRFHALLMALKAGKPVVGIPYDPKVSQMCKDFQQPMLNLPQDSGSNASNSWLATFESAVSNQLELAKKAEMNASYMQEKSCQNFEILAKILNS